MIHSDFERYHGASEIIAPFFGKAFACFVASGMAAVELALEYLGVGKDHQVLVADNVSHTIPTAILRVGALPIFVPTDDRILPRLADILSSVSRQTAAIVVVHSFGLPFPIKLLRAALPPRIRIIEDCAQAFGVISQGEQAGRYSDVVVTSLGPTKPLRLDGGGVLLGNDPDVLQLMTRKRHQAGPAAFAAKPYTLSPSLLSGLKDAVDSAVNSLESRRASVDRSLDRLRSLGADIWQCLPGDKPSWHRVPIYPIQQALAGKLRDLARAGTLVQLPHREKTWELPQFSDVRPPDVAPSSPPGYLLVRPEGLGSVVAAAASP